MQKGKGYTLEKNGPPRATLNPDGSEVVDSTPMAPPLGYKKSESVHEMIQRQVRSELLRREIEAAGGESFDEANDFNVEDDVENLPPGYEVHERDGSVVPDRASQPASGPPSSTAVASPSPSKPDAAPAAPLTSGPSSSTPTG